MNYKTRVINLDRRPDRWEQFTKTADEMKLTYERFSAVDGKTLNVGDELTAMFRNNRFNWRRGMMGACLSHYSLWKELVESEYDYYFILEDDNKYCDDFSGKLGQLVEKLFPKVDELVGDKEGDKENETEKKGNDAPRPPLVLLGYTTDKEFIKKMYDHNLDDVLLYKLKSTTHVWGGIFAYFLHRSFAEVLVEDVKREGFIKPVDMTLLSYNNNFYVTAPTLVTSDFMSAVYNIDSDIQYDLLGIHDGYDFYCLKDSVGFDMPVIHSGKTIDELRKIADADDSCKGFNTYGYLKTFIRPESEFIKLPGTEYKLHGLYVKV